MTVSLILGKEYERGSRKNAPKRNPQKTTQSAVARSIRAFIINRIKQQELVWINVTAPLCWDPGQVALDRFLPFLFERLIQVVLYINFLLRSCSIKETATVTRCIIISCLNEGEDMAKGMNLASGYSCKVITKLWETKMASVWRAKSLGWELSSHVSIKV